MTNPKVLIVEDDLIIASHISAVLTAADIEVSEIVTKGESALSFLETNSVDAILMDINLAGKLDGIDTAKKINSSRNVPVVFLTGNSDDTSFQKAKEAFPVGFLSKPFKDENLIRALEIVFNQKELKDPETSVASQEQILSDRIFVRYKNKMKKLSLKDILYVEAERNYCKITTKEKEYTLSIPLIKFEEKVSSSQFLRIHRSHLVNVNAIDELDEHYVFINGKSLSVSKSYKSELTQRLTLL